MADQLEPFVLISIGADGAIFWDGQGVGLEELERRAKQGLVEKPSQNYGLKPSPRVHYQFVVDVLGTLQRVGIKNLSFVPNDG
jgi:biopolymer transport protein ExbD